MPPVTSFSLHRQVLHAYAGSFCFFDSGVKQGNSSVRMTHPTAALMSPCAGVLALLYQLQGSQRSCRQVVKLWAW